jgi:hypothetical protein
MRRVRSLGRRLGVCCWCGPGLDAILSADAGSYVGIGSLNAFVEFQATTEEEMETYAIRSNSPKLHVLLPHFEGEGNSVTT